VVHVKRGPRQEFLEDRRLGPAGAELLYGAVRSVALSRNFPPPEGHAAWDGPAVQGFAHDFLTSTRGPARLQALVLSSTDEDSFARLLHTAVLNAHRDRGRATELGALVLRVTEILTDSPQFRRATEPGRWVAAEGPDEPSSVPFRVLAAAAAGVRDVHVPRWSSATRRSPAADRDSFVRLLAAILNAAKGSLPSSELARACAHRLDPRHVPITIELDILEYPGGPRDETQGHEEVLNRIVARDLLESLSDRERLLAGTWDMPVREAAARLGLGHSQTAVLRRQLVEHLTRELQSEPDGEDVLSAMLSMAQADVHQRTGTQDATL